MALLSAIAFFASSRSESVFDCTLLHANGRTSMTIEIRTWIVFIKFDFGFEFDAKETGMLKPKLYESEQLTVIKCSAYREAVSCVRRRSKPRKRFEFSDEM